MENTRLNSIYHPLVPLHTACTDGEHIFERFVNFNKKFRFGCGIYALCNLCDLYAEKIPRPKRSADNSQSANNDPAGSGSRRKAAEKVILTPKTPSALCVIKIYRLVRGRGRRTKDEDDGWINTKTPSAQREDILIRLKIRQPAFVLIKTSVISAGSV